MSNRYVNALQSLLANADVMVGGKRPWDIQVRNPEFAQRILADGSLGAGESYMDGEWECAQLDEMLYRIVRARGDTVLPHMRELWAALLARVMNLQSPRRSFKVGREHYDIGDDLYECMLDRRMIYSCAYWKSATDLDAAQEAKLDLVCRKLGLRSGMRVLDIGCGWGGAAQFAAERYGVSVVGVTVSENQAVVAKERCKGLPIEIRLQDYRSLATRFDRIYSMGMFEHVGHRNYRSFFTKARSLLEPDGLMLLHTIGSNISNHANDAWIERYIFPNSLIPSMSQIAEAAEGNFVMEDWHGFGPDYDRTLMEWHARFTAHWPELAQKYGDRFKRMWDFWLLASAVHFRTRRNQLWQMVFSPQGVVGGVAAVR